MRSLASGRHSAGEVAARLAEDHTVGVEFYVADRNGQILDRLEVVRDPDPVIACNTGQQVKMDVGLACRPHALLRPAGGSFQAFRYRIKAVGLLGMRDGSNATFSLGTFVPVWPAREVRLAAHGVDELWTMKVGCRTHLLNLKSPLKFAAEKGERATDVVNRLLRMAGVREQVARLPATLNATYDWALTKPKVVSDYERLLQRYEGIARDKHAKQSARVSALKNVRSIRRWLRSRVVNASFVTYLSIINEVAAACGLDDLWFDWDDRPRLEPKRDESRVRPAPEVTYRPVSQGGLLTSGYKTDTDHARRRNQITVRPADPTLKRVTLSLDDVMPAHPFAPRNCGEVIPDVVDEPNALDQFALHARCRKEVMERGGLVEATRFESLWNPAHEQFDPVGVQMPGDAELGSLTGLVSSQFQVDCGDLGVAHEARRVWTG